MEERMKLTVPLTDCPPSVLISVALAARHLERTFHDSGDHPAAVIFGAVADGADAEGRRRISRHGPVVDHVTVALDDEGPDALYLASEMVIAASMRLRDANPGPGGDVWQGLAASLLNERSRRRWDVIALERSLGPTTISG
jgi:hypothetical protein